MENKSIVMQEIFSNLQKEIKILIAKSVNIDQENPKQQRNPPKQSAYLSEL